MSLYHSPTAKGTPAYEKAVTLIADAEAKALIKGTYSRDVNTNMTYDEFERAGKDIKNLKKVLDRLDHAQYDLRIAKENKLSDKSIAEDQKFVDAALADL